jgi:cysteine desulfurase family protein
MLIYLDNAATTFPKPQKVIDAVNECMRSGCVNAGRGVYPFARSADLTIQQTRTLVADLLGFPNGQTVFTPSATIALNQIILGTRWNSGDTIYSTSLEHNSVARPLEELTRAYSVKLKQLPLDRETLEYDIKQIEEDFFRNPPKALVMSHVSNVCGLITPIEAIASLAKKHGALIVIDGAQGGPLLPQINNENLIDFYVFSGHKTFYGPFGIAGFVSSGTVNLKPLLFGGTGSHSEFLTMPESLPMRFEVGSHNIVAISGLKAACEWLMDVKPQNIVDHERRLLEKAINGISGNGECRLFVNMNVFNNLGTFSFSINGYTSQEIGSIFSQNYDISIRAGLHCAPMAHSFLGTLPYGTARVSFGYHNSEQDVQTLVQAINEITE